MPRSPRTTKPRQAALPFRQHGGARPGAGRKPRHGIAGVSHHGRADLPRHCPVLVTLKLRAGLPRLRRAAERAALLEAFRNHHTNGAAASVVQFVILNDHLHLLVEAASTAALGRGLQGLCIRIARTLNRLWARRGAVFADRYHARALATPREVRHALRYLLANGWKHAAAGRAVQVPAAVDTFSSAPWFDGFRERVVCRNLPAGPAPVRPARTWLLGRGWRRLGRLSIGERPA